MFGFSWVNTAISDNKLFAYINQKVKTIWKHHTPSPLQEYYTHTHKSKLVIPRLTGRERRGKKDEG